MAAQRAAGGRDLATREAGGPRPGTCQSSDVGDSEQSSRIKKAVLGIAKDEGPETLVARASVATHGND